MKVGSLSPVQIGDATFWVKKSWGLKKAYQSQLMRIGYREDAAPEQQGAMMDGYNATTRDLIAQAVVRCDGVTDAEGQPTKWADVDIDELEPETIDALGEAILRLLGIGPSDEGNAEGG